MAASKVATDETLQSYSRLIGRSVVAVAPLASGHNTKLEILTLSDGTELVAKSARATSYGTTLEIEAHMLEFLHEHSSLPVPKLVHHSDDILIMSKLPSGGGIPHKAEEQAAEMVAALHTIKGKQFGLEFDTVIGPLHQPNHPLSDEWIPFFAEHRLLYMAEHAFHEGALNAPLAGKIEKLAGRLSEWLEEPEYPSLIHGDLWQGNVLASGNQISGFIDPAIYYAHPEIELAFTTLFGTFSERFFKRYHEICPIAPGFFDCRREIYNLYPLLVHVRLYGGGYVQQVARTVQRFIG